MIINNSKIIDPNYNGEHDKVIVPNEKQSLDDIKKSFINKLKNKK